MPSIHSQNNRIYSVSELNQETKNLLSIHFSSIQIEGEISNLSAPVSGHIYFSLKDNKAQIRCAMFKSQKQSLNFTPKNGQQVIISAQVSLYEARGDYQLIASTMKEAGEGDLQIAFETLKNKLKNEGAFEPHLKQILPAIPSSIGVITSPTGAAIQDILSVLKRRFPATSVTIYPTTVQGTLAKNEICSALKVANNLKQVDVIILARGGGSIEDLWAFNEECVARAIINSDIPIISGIGHDTDFTISDFVADLHAPTPSVAAERAVPNKANWSTHLQIIKGRLERCITHQLLISQQSLYWTKKRLQQRHPRQKLQDYAQTLDDSAQKLLNILQTKIKYQQRLLNNQQHALKQQNPSVKIAHYKEQQLYLATHLKRAMQHKLEKVQQQHIYLVQRLQSISPLATLERGYAIVSQENSSTIINSSQKVSINDTVDVRLSHGKLTCQITDITYD